MKNKFFLILLSIILTACSQTQQPIPFDGNSAYQFAEKQLSFGERSPGTEGHQHTIEWITQTLAEFDWNTELQQLSVNEKPIVNIIATRNNHESPYIILGAHYDTRFYADNDPYAENQTLPVPGANDGASGVAVLLELARTLPDNIDKNIMLVFFDSEDQGSIEDWEWIMGSTAFADNLEINPDQVIIVDMIGDKDLNIYYERNSDPQLQKEIWETAAALGYEEVFIQEYKYSMLDDHTPFLRKGVQAIDIIDFDYLYWHSIEDTLDKISPESLHAVGDTLYHWIISSETNP